MQRYLDKVLSDVRGKRARNEISAELSDHIISNEEKLLDIGYDSESAKRESDERMGDAHTVGQQLDLIMRRKSIRRLVLLLLSIISAAACVAVYLIEEKTLLFIKSSEFGVFLGVWAIYLFCLGVMIVDVKRGQTVSAAVSAIGLCSVAILTPDLVNSLILSFDTERLIAIFFSGWAYSASYFYFPEKIMNYGVLAVFIIVPVASVLFSAFVTFRTRMLKNTKSDFTIKKAVIAVLSLFGVICIVLVFAITVRCVVHERRSIEAAHDAIVEIDELVLDNLDLILGNDAKAAVEFLEENAPEGAEFNKDYTEEEGRFERTAMMIFNGITMSIVFDNGGISYLDISPSLVGLNGTIPEIITAAELAAGKGYSGELQGAPRSCLIEMSRKNGFIRLRYGTNMYSSGKYIEYSFRKNKNEYSIEYSKSVFETPDDVGLSLEQKKLLKAALYEYSRDEACDRYLDYDGEPFMKIFGASYDKKTDEYKIDMYFCPEWVTMIDGKLYWIDINEFNDYCSVKVRFNDKKAEILSVRFPTDKDRIEDIFSEKANRLRSKWRGYTDFLYKQLVRLEEKYGQKVFAVISAVEDEGTLHYLEVDYNETYYGKNDKESILRQAYSSKIPFLGEFGTTKAEP